MFFFKPNCQFERLVRLSLKKLSVNYDKRIKRGITVSHEDGLWHRAVDALMRFQYKYCIPILLAGLVLTGFCFKSASHLLTTVATELIHLLPDNYPSVKLTDEMGTKFNRRSSLYVIINSPNPKANEQAIKDLKPFLEKNELVSEASIEKEGYDFIDKNKLMLMDLEDLYKIRDKLSDKIQKKKLEI